MGLAHSIGADPVFPEDWAYRPYFSVPDEWFGNAEDALQATDLAITLPAEMRPYLQDLRLFADVASEVREVLQPSPLAVEAIEACTDFGALEPPILSVHVRRGDNVYDPAVPDKHLYYPVPSLAYYDKAVALITHAREIRSVAVFGDDPAWNQEFIAGDWYGEGRARKKESEPGYATEPVFDWLDFFLQARCDAHVLSNSTFGIMAAWVAGDDHVTYPWPHYGPKILADASLMFPPGWVRLPSQP